MNDYYEELNRKLKKISTLKEFSSLKNKLLRKYKLEKQPSNIQILTSVDSSLYNKLKFLVTKPTRTISGVAPIAIMTKPFKCPHGKCTYCPGGIKSYFGTVPQSYTGHEPASMRAKRNFYDPYLQVFNRLEQYALLNQNFNKVELIIMGGTFLSTPPKYQNDFITYSFKAMNDFSCSFFKDDKFDFIRFKDFFELPADVHDKKRTRRLQERIIGLKKQSNLEKEQLRNEKSDVRCVALALETRPDYCKENHINNALAYGATRIELGVQALKNEILKKINRGHDVRDVIKTTQLLKDSFFKIGYHVMPGLPGSTKKTDIEMFKELFSNQDFRPDALKIYPCMVMKGTGLYELYRNKKFKPLTTHKAAEIIAEAKRYIPKYTRIMRIQRDIPTKITTAGVDATNFRQYVDKLLKEKRIRCNCIRCREPKGNNIDFNKIKILKTEYEASNGKEVFISAEDRENDVIAGFCRLRLPYKPFRKEITTNSVGIREIHVYGASTKLGEIGHAIQHKGIGTRLLEEAERLAIENFMANKVLIISGIGVKPYFYKFGYKKDGPYLSKKI